MKETHKDHTEALNNLLLSLQKGKESKNNDIASFCGMVLEGWNKDIKQTTKKQRISYNIQQLVDCTSSELFKETWYMEPVDKMNMY